jgi:hypothetical protein
LREHGRGGGAVTGDVRGLGRDFLDQVQLKLPFESREISNPLASVFAQHQISHLHAAETEKYAHVTYFFNGGKEPPFEHETRIFVPSPNVATYDLKPEMSAAEIVQKVIPHIGKTDFSVINFANADMVGHTGNFEAAIKAVNTVDRCLNKVLKEVVNTGGLAHVTADHGNAEQMINPLTGMEDTEHTTNLVPFAIVGKDVNKYKTLLEDGRLSDIAPTILEIMEIDKPKEATSSAAADALPETALPPDLEAALKEPAYRPEREVWKALRQDGLLNPAILILALFLATLTVMVEAILLQGVLRVSQTFGMVSQRFRIEPS